MNELTPELLLLIKIHGAEAVTKNLKLKSPYS